MNSKDSAPAGIPNILRSGENNENFPGRIELVRRIVRTKKGNKEGTTVRIHNSMPSAAPESAVALSNIRISIPKQGSSILNTVRFTIGSFTSQENMRIERKEFQTRT